VSEGAVWLDLPPSRPDLERNLTDRLVRRLIVVLLGARAWRALLREVTITLTPPAFVTSAGSFTARAPMRAIRREPVPACAWRDGPGAAADDSYGQIVSLPQTFFPNAFPPCTCSFASPPLFIVNTLPA
jgi:hypothetical protein